MKKIERVTQKTTKDLSTEATDKYRAEELAVKLGLLFDFCSVLIPYKDLIKKTADLCADKESTAVSAAVIFGAFGQDYRAVETEARIRKERAEAIFNLIDTLERTERERAEYRIEQKNKQAGLAVFNRAFGFEG